MQIQGKPKRRSKATAQANGENEDWGIGLSITNGEDLGPIIRKAFESGKPEALLHQLRSVVRKQEQDIEDVCKLHYQDFIHAVDELRGLLSDADALRSAISEVNSKLQQAGNPLLDQLEGYIETVSVQSNVCLAIQGTSICYQVMELCDKANKHIKNGNYYMVLKCLDTLERDYLDRIPANALEKMVSKKIPAMRSYVEKKVNLEFNDWLVQIRATAKEIGQIAIGQASLSRQREEELRKKQREAEEQSRVSLRDCVYSLENMETDDTESFLKFDLCPVYRAFHINTCLGLKEQFKEYYFENRTLQLSSDFQISSSQSFLEVYQVFLAQTAGFFIVEDRVQRTAGDLISRARVDELWESAVNKMCSVLVDQFSRIQTASHLLLIKDYVSLLGVTLKNYNYQIDPLLDVLLQNKDKYHELLFNEKRKQIADVLANDRYDQMLMKKEYEYNMNVLAFHIQTSDIMPAFPYIAPFSSSVPECCRIVRSFIEDSVNYMSHSGQMDIYDVVKKYLDKLLVNVLNESLINVIKNSSFAVSQAIQFVANLSILERACDFFIRHAAQLSGIPIRLAERLHSPQVLKGAIYAAQENMITLVNSKAEEFMQLMENINWTADEVPQHGNEYMNELLIYLETLISTVQHILPLKDLEKLSKEVLKHISDCIVNTLLSDNVKRFSIAAIMGIDTDVKLLESLADNQFRECGLHQLEGARNPKESLAEIRQLVNLLLSNKPETYINPVIREKHYSALDYKKVAIISEKFKETSERLFGSFGGRSMKQNTKKKSMDVLIKRLRELS